MPGQNIGPRTQHPVLVKLTHEEHAQIKRNAGGGSVAEFMRNVGLNHLPMSMTDARTLQELQRLKGDLGRVGGLLKLWLTERPGDAVSMRDVRDGLNRILELQTETGDLVARLDAKVRRVR